MTILDFLYEQYCRARLVEMRKQLLLRSPENDDLADADLADRDRARDHHAAGEAHEAQHT